MRYLVQTTPCCSLSAQWGRLPILTCEWPQTEAVHVPWSCFPSGAPHAFASFSLHRMVFTSPFLLPQFLPEHDPLKSSLLSIFSTAGNWSTRELHIFILRVPFSLQHWLQVNCRPTVRSPLPLWTALFLCRDWSRGTHSLHLVLLFLITEIFFIGSFSVFQLCWGHWFCKVYCFPYSSLFHLGDALYVSDLHRHQCLRYPEFPINLLIF